MADLAQAAFVLCVLMLCVPQNTRAECWEVVQALGFVILWK